MSKNFNRAFTLLEVTVVFGLLTMGLVMMGWVSTFAVRWYLRADQRGDAQRALILASARISRDLLATRLYSMQHAYPGGDPDSLHLAMASPYAVDGSLLELPGNGALSYQSQVFYWRRQGELYRWSRPVAATLDPEPLLPADLLAVPASAIRPQVLMPSCLRFQAVSGILPQANGEYLLESGERSLRFTGVVSLR